MPTPERRAHPVPGTENNLLSETFATDILATYGLRRESLSQPNQALYDLVVRGTQEALERIRKAFGGEPTDEHTLPYHSTAHTQSVIIDTVRILTCCLQDSSEQLSEASAVEVLVGMLVAAWHDVVQDYRRAPKTIATGSPYVVRTRLPTRLASLLRLARSNEWKSARQLVRYLTQNSRAQRSEQDRSLLAPDAITATIEVTIPAFGDYPGTKIPTVYQPLLRPDSPLIATALAFADLNAVGWMELGPYLRESRKNFREEDLSIFAMIYRDHYISSQEQEQILRRIKAFYARELAFIQGRYAAYKHEIAYFDSHHAKVAKLYPNFASDDVVGALIARVTENQHQVRLLPLRQQLVELGYTMDAVTIEGEGRRN